MYKSVTVLYEKIVAHICSTRLVPVKKIKLDEYHSSKQGRADDTATSSLYVAKILSPTNNDPKLSNTKPCLPIIPNTRVDRGVVLMGLNTMVCRRTQ